MYFSIGGPNKSQNPKRQSKEYKARVEHERELAKHSDHPQKRSKKHEPDWMDEKEYKASVRPINEHSGEKTLKELEKEFEALKREEVIESNPKSETMPQLNDEDLEKARHPEANAEFEAKKLLHEILKRDNPDYRRSTVRLEPVSDEKDDPYDEYHLGTKFHDAKRGSMRELYEEEVKRLELK